MAYVDDNAQDEDDDLENDDMNFTEDQECFFCCNIECGWPGSNPKDAEFFSVCKLKIEKSKKNTNLQHLVLLREKAQRAMK